MILVAQKKNNEQYRKTSIMPLPRWLEFYRRTLFAIRLNVARQHQMKGAVQCNAISGTSLFGCMNLKLQIPNTNHQNKSCLIRLKFFEKKDSFPTSFSTKHTYPDKPWKSFRLSGHHHLQTVCILAALHQHTLHCWVFRWQRTRVFPGDLPRVLYQFNALLAL